VEVYKGALPLIVLCQERDLGIDDAVKQGNWQKNTSYIQEVREEKEGGRVFCMEAEMDGVRI
jgi:hypothetical protein